MSWICRLDPYKPSPEICIFLIAILTKYASKISVMQIIYDHRGIWRFQKNQ